MEKDVEQLIADYLSGQASEKDVNALSVWLDDDDHKKVFSDYLRVSNLVLLGNEWESILSDEAWKLVADRYKKRKRRFRNYSLAAAICLLVGLACVLQLIVQNKQDTDPLKNSWGKRVAILEMPDGRTYQLGSQTLTLDNNGGEEIVADSLSLVYPVQTASGGKDKINHKITVPPGGEYTISLSDGSRIWLNSATEVEYPPEFAADSREIRVEGEVYLEVAPDSERPFYVRAGDVIIRVYGTSFNVNTHRKESIRTVLLEGAVGIRGKDSDKELRLSPGEMAEYFRSDGQLQIREVDVWQYIAWKSGVFTFDNEDLEQIMYTLSLWYNVKIDFQTEGLKYLHFSGYLGKYEEIEKILDAITVATGVRFETIGRSITVKSPE